MTAAPNVALDHGAAAGSREVLLEVRNLAMHFPIRRGFLGRTVGQVRAVDGVSFALYKGETLGLVGESGCGKTTTGRCILRAYDPTGGEIRYRRADGRTVDLARLDKRRLRPLRREISMIFQDPYSSLNPRMNLLQAVGEPLKVNNVASGKELERRVATLLRRVGLRPEYLRRYPHAFSGGERQRVGIARALALNPRLIVADEAVSALDVSVRAQVLNLLEELKGEMGLTYLFVAHDLSVVQHSCDRVAVMYLGKLVELAETEQLYTNPQMPYTEALLSAVPRPDPRLRGDGRRIVLQGEVPSPADPPPGCPFHPRCRYAQERCRVEAPRLREVRPGHLAACHFSEQLSLRGVGAVGPAPEAKRGGGRG
jgi:peptide/nickel transport system ATP-binding protein